MVQNTGPSILGFAFAWQGLSKNLQSFILLLARAGSQECGHHAKGTRAYRSKIEGRRVCLLFQISSGQCCQSNGYHGMSYDSPYSHAL